MTRRMTREAKVRAVGRFRTKVIQEREREREDERERMREREDDEEDDKEEK